MTLKCRLRHYHVQTKNVVIEFIIQLEIEIDNKWYPVTRFDTKHGFAHQDICHYNGKIEKINLGINNYNIAMTFAEQDLKRNWNVYKERFLKEANKND